MAEVTSQLTLKKEQPTDRREVARATCSCGKRGRTDATRNSMADSQRVKMQR
jgi:hypothetical protein